MDRYVDTFEVKKKDGSSNVFTIRDSKTLKELNDLTNTVDNINITLEELVSKKAKMYQIYKATSSSAVLVIKLKAVTSYTPKGCITIDGSLNNSPCRGCVEVSYANGEWFQGGGFITYMNNGTVYNEELTCSISGDTLTITLPSQGVYGNYYLMSMFDIS